MPFNFLPFIQIGDIYQNFWVNFYVKQFKNVQHLFCEFTTYVENHLCLTTRWKPLTERIYFDDISSVSKYNIEVSLIDGEHIF